MGQTWSNYLPSFSNKDLISDSNNNKTNNEQSSPVDSFVEAPLSRHSSSSSQNSENMILHCKENEDGYIFIEKQSSPVDDPTDIDPDSHQDTLNDMESILSISNYEDENWPTRSGSDCKTLIQQ